MLLKKLWLVRALRRNANSLSFVFDLDGVLTDGTFWYSNQGKELKRFGPHDAEALQKLKEYFEVKVISADNRGSEISKRRISDIGLDLEIVSANDRANFIHSLKLQKKKVVFVGDSLSDIPALQVADFAFCPKDAFLSVHKNVDLTLLTEGGRGVAAEVLMLIRYCLKRETGFKGLE